MEKNFDDEPDMTFSKEVRNATKQVHKISDALVNAKFALALNDEKVWADSLLCFYEIYKYLEANLSENYLPPELHRKEAFEMDLDYFLGENWKINYEPRESVKKYLKHLEEVRTAKGEHILFAYGLQMYMAIMSGGQLLQKKRMIARKLWMSNKEEEKIVQPLADPNADPSDLQARPMPLQVTICAPGCNATYFPEKISVLKAKLRNILNREYAQFDEKTKEEFLEESRNVFLYNSQVVRSVRGMNAANLRKLAWFLTFVLSVYFSFKIGKYFNSYS